MKVASGSSKGYCYVNIVVFFCFDKNSAYSVFFFTSKLAGCLEVDTKVREFTLVVFADILDCVDVERHSKAMDREDYGLCLAVDKDL